MALLLQGIQRQKRNRVHVCFPFFHALTRFGSPCIMVASIGLQQSTISGQDNGFQHKQITVQVQKKIITLFSCLRRCPSFEFDRQRQFTKLFNQQKRVALKSLSPFVNSASQLFLTASKTSLNCLVLNSSPKLM